MKQKIKTVAKFLSYIIRRFFIINNSYIKTTLKIIQLTVAVYNENLHYIRRKIITKKEKYLVTGVLASSIIYWCSNWRGENRKRIFEERSKTNGRTSNYRNQSTNNNR